MYISCHCTSLSRYVDLMRASSFNTVLVAFFHDSFTMDVKAGAIASMQSMQAHKDRSGLLPEAAGALDPLLKLSISAEAETIYS